MSFFLDLDDDFDVFDNTEEVTLTQVGTNVAVEVCALRRQISVREAAASGGAYTAGDVAFSIRRSKVCKTPPGVGSLITTADAELFTILGVDLASLKSRFRCHCRQPIMQTNLDQLLDIQEPQYLLDTMDAPYTEWVTLHQKVRGKVYTVSEANQVARDTRDIDPKVMIYLVDVSDVRPNFRIKDEAGVYYNVSKVTTPPLGGLVAIEATTYRTPLAM